MTPVPRSTITYGPGPADLGGRNGAVRPRGLLSALMTTWLGGAAVIAGTVAVAAMMSQAGFYISGIIVACLGGLALLVLCMWLNRHGAIFTVAFIGMVIVVIAALLAQEEVVLFGSSATDVAVADAPKTGAALLHFRDARVLADRAESKAVWAGSKGTHHIAYYLWVAPVVGADWTPDRPVTVLAVIGSPQLGHRRSEWREPWNAGITLNGQNDVERMQASRNIVRYQHLTVADDAVFIRWTADPERAAAGARRRLAITVLIAAAAWTLLAFVGNAWAALRP